MRAELLRSHAPGPVLRTRQNFGNTVNCNKMTKIYHDFYYYYYYYYFFFYYYYYCLNYDYYFYYCYYWLFFFYC